MSVSVLLAVGGRPDYLLVLEQLLAAHLPDIKLLAAPDAEAGLKLAASEAIDGALIDVQIPGMNGIEMCRRLKRDPRTASIHVILVTARRASPELKAQGLEAGADDFIAKPIDNIELAARLRAMLRLRAAENPICRERDHLEEEVLECTRELRDAEYRYRTLFNAAADAIFINDLEGRMLEVNEEACRLLGYAPEELLHLAVSDVVTPESAARRPEILKQLQTTGHLVFVTELVTRDGRIIPTECSSRLMDLLDLHGRSAVLSIVRDITERKRVEETLLKYEFIANTANDCMTLINRNYIYEAANAVFCKAHGKTREEVVGTSLANIWGEDRFKNYIKGDLDRCFTGQTVESVDWFEFGKMGRGCYHVFYTPYFNEDGTVAYAAVVSHDITVRKRDEESLRKSEEKFRLVFERAPIGIMHYDQTSTITDCNEKFAEIIGAPREKFIGFNMIRQLRDEQMRKAVAASLRGEVGYYRGDYLSVTAGKLTPVRAIYQPIFSLQGVLSGGMAIFEDITERQRAQEALRKSEKRNRAILRTAMDGFWRVDLQGRLLEVNDAYCQMSGYSEAELLAMRVLDLEAAETPADIATRIQKVVAQGQARFETRHRRKDGSIFQVEVSVQHKRAEEEQMFAFLRDITDRKLAEMALRKNEELYRSLFDSMLNGFAYCKMLFEENRPLDFFYLAVNSSFEALTGLKNVVGKKVSEVIPGIGESDPELLKVYGRVALTGKPERVEIYVEALKMWFSLSVYSPEKEHFVAVFDVITNRKQAEEELALHTTRLQALVDLRLLAEAPQEQFLDFVLEASLRTTQSEYCWVGLMDEAESALSINRWSKKVMKQCAVTGKPIIFPVAEGGLWGDCVRQRKSVLVNDYQAPHPNKKGFPEGHVPIRRFLAVPVLDGGRTVAIAAVANKGTDYTEDDIRAFTSLVNKMWEILRRRQTEAALKESLARTTAVQDGTIQALATVTEARDPYTAGHQRRVTQLACAVARELELPADLVAGLRVMGLLHDIGKISIPAEILSKPGKLSDMESKIIEFHAQAGYDILKEIQFPWPVAQVVLQHHERLDGSGYPQGLKGDEIVLEARILAVADVVEAMASHRPYRPALGIEKALEEVSRNRETLYDPLVVDACVKLFREKGYELL